MQAILIDAAGPAANLTYTDIAVPEIGPDEVLIKVKAISINPVDVKARASEGVLTWLFGATRPVILGWDISGVVVGVGKDVTHLTSGDAVFGMINFLGQGKAYAEYVAAPASQLARKPANLSHSEAAAATLAALTAWQTLTKHAPIKPGQRVLIHAASGGVGHYAVQLAKHLGAYVIGTSSAANRDFVLSLGADEHIDYTTQRFEQVATDVDFVLDTIEGDTLTRSIDIVKPGGTVISIPTGNFPESTVEQAQQRGIRLAGMMVQSDGADMASIADLLANGRIRSYIARAFRFDEMPKAHELVETGRVRGKVTVLLG